MLRFTLVLAAALCWAEDKPPKRPEPAKAAPRPRMDAAARRNENVVVNRIDNDVVKELNVRLGDDVTIVPAPAVEAGYYAAEHGRPPATLFVRPPAASRDWHAELFEWHQNSVFNARTFFQVGGVQPSRRNTFGGRGTAGLGKLGAVSADVTERKIRGMVNGNVLVPLASERTPLAADPAARAIVSRFLAAYPAGLPNRLDFDPRALNTNAPQSIDETDANVRLDRDAGANARLSASYALTRQHINAFQFVAGQNPNTDIHAHAARLSYRRSTSAASELVLAASFQRVASLLTSPPGAVGPRVKLGFQIQELGPDSMFPIDRAQNSYRYGALASRTAGAHVVTFGADLTRFQLNGIESSNQRGFFQFTNNFGRTAIENLLYGTPSSYEVTIGELARGFRNWTVNGFAADKWTVSPRLQLYYGLRYNAVAAPVEVHRLDRIPYGCDCNNFSPRFSIAYRLPRAWVLRASYTVSFGEILPVTYQQVRNNLPLVRYIQVPNPDLVDPLRGVDLQGPNARTSPTVLSPDLVSPYSHQYSLRFERSLTDRFTVRAGYLGSRSFKELNAFVTNRADPVPGIPLTSATIDLRRPDPRYYEVKNILNAGIAYLDAAQASFDARLRGLTAGATYTFGKALDEGADYAGTGANNDVSNNRNQWQYESARDRKGLSLFDSTHALVLYYTYEVPRPAAAHGWTGRLLGGWQVSGVSMIKSGTPLTLYIGSDAPGFGNVDGGPSERPNIVDPSILGMTFSNPDTAPLIMRRDRFAYIAPGEHRGNLGRSTFRKSPIKNFNAAVSRQWRWGAGERAIMFRAEAYNLTNHPQFDEPQRNLTSPAFGKITNTLNDGRVLQLGLRLML